MRAHGAGVRAWILVTVLVMGLAAPVAAADPSPSPVVSPAPAVASLFVATGELVDGAWWLRDGTGSQYATWSFAGRPTGAPVTVTFALPATDAMGGGPREMIAWVTIGAIEQGAPGPVILGPSLQTFPIGSAADMTIEPGELSATMDGLWVLVERRAPTGAVVPVWLAASREAVTVTGLAPDPSYMQPG